MNPLVSLRQAFPVIVRHGHFIWCELYRSLSSCVYPPFCFICEDDLNKREHLVCERCWSSFDLIDRPYCQRCGLPLKVRDTTCACCESTDFCFSATRAAYVYTEDVRKVIHAFKFQRKTSLARRLGRIMAFTIGHDTHFKDVDCLVPVPLHPSRFRERGYNQSALLASEISAELGVNSFPAVLARKKSTKAMTALTPERRLRNVENAFAVTNPETLKGKNVALVDDVFTTGATVNACARALMEAGVAEVKVVTLARAS